MEINITYILPEADLTWQELSAYLPCLSLLRQRRVEHYAFEKDKIASVLAGLLARREIASALEVDGNSLRFDFLPFGKPYLPDFPHFSFSLSHTDGCVAFAGGDCAVGIDAERIAARPLRLADRFFTPAEAEALRNSADPMAMFYEIWTKKEAYVKMLGRGLSLPFRSFDVRGDKAAAEFTVYKRESHIITLCRAPEDGKRPVCFRETTVSELLEAFRP